MPEVSVIDPIFCNETVLGLSLSMDCVATNLIGPTGYALRLTYSKK